MRKIVYKPDTFFSEIRKHQYAKCIQVQVYKPDILLYRSDKGALSKKIVKKIIEKGI